MQKLDLKGTRLDKSKLVKNLAQGNVLAPYLDRAFQTFDGPFEFKYTGKQSDDAWHPSGDCIPPVSDLYRKAMGESLYAPPGSSLRKIFMVGHYWHQLLQHIVVEVLQLAPAESVEREGQKVWDRIPNPSYPHDGDEITQSMAGYEGTPMTLPAPYHWVHGSADIAPFEHNGFKGLVDFKTMSDYQFKQSTLGDWYEKYTCQMNIYMDLFDLEHALILGINKNNGEFKEIQVHRDQKLINAIYDKWSYVGSLVSLGETPDSKDDEVFQLPL